MHDIIAHSKSDKENMSSPLDNACLGRIISSLWQGKVRSVQKGPRKNQKRGYLNLRKKTVEIDVEQRMGNDLLPNIDLPRGWQLEITHSNLACIYRRDPLEFNGQRLTLELELDLSSRDNREFIIKSQVFKVEFTTLMSNASIAGLSLHEQINYILEYLQNSTVCRGIPLQEGETIISLTPHFTGDMEELSGSKGKESRAFSAKCLVISTGNDAQCKNCKILKKVNSQRVARRESRTFDTPDARSNKKFLSKEEVVRQLSDERRKKKNAERRSTYWQEKFANEALCLEKEDETDMSNIFSSIKKTDIPADMLSLWEQQEKILQCSSARGYRWHPK